VGQTKHDGLAIPGRVILAREPDFRLGNAVVHPSTRRIELNGQSHLIEPRMMQVLVALARADGQVVTRDELVELCWEGRVVGEDAINRVIWRLRQLSQRLGPGTFSVVTVARVGVRLDIAQAIHRDERPAVPRASRRALIAGGAAAVGFASLGVVKWATEDPSPDPRARRHFDRGMQLRGQAALAQTEQSIAFFKEATRIDPQYAEAWGALAWAYRSLFDYGPRADWQRMTIASRSAARRALALDSSNADATAALLLLDPMYGRWTEVENGLRKILARDPDHTVSEYCLTALLAETGRWTLAIPALERLSAQEPFWPIVRWRLCDALVSAERVDEAEEALESAMRVWPRRFDLWQLKTRFLLVSGRHSEALDLANDDSRAPAEAGPLVACERAVAAAYAESSAAARRTAVKFIVGETRRFPLCFPAATAAFIGEHGLAFEMFQGYFLGRGSWESAAAKWPFTFPLFTFETKSIRSDARFDELVRNIGLEDYWRTTGRAPDYRLA